MEMAENVYGANTLRFNEVFTPRYWLIDRYVFQLIYTTNLVNNKDVKNKKQAKKNGAALRQEKGGDVTVNVRGA